MNGRFWNRDCGSSVKGVAIMEYGIPQGVQNRLWPSAREQKSMKSQKGRDAISRATEIVRGLICRHVRNPSREFDLWLVERRLERVRIAGELHDTLFQGFLGASLVVGVTLQNMSEDSPARASLSRAARLMERAIEEGRAVLQALRSSAIASGSLEGEFSDLLREIAPASGVQARILVIGHARELKPEIQHQIYLIGREALVNAFRHANATSIETEIVYLRSHLRVVVRDNGCGIDAQIVQSGRASHWGLVGMRERAKGIGAEVRIYSRRGDGTDVEISIPSSIVAAV
jgi:signal transduction histidine kinase